MIRHSRSESERIGGVGRQLFAVNLDGVIQIARNFVDAATLHKSTAKRYKCYVHDHNWLVEADSVDEAQRRIVRVLESEGVQSTGAGVFQLEVSE